MTLGQERALRELERLCKADPNTFEVVRTPVPVGDFIVTEISLRLGQMETKKGGLDLRERENLFLLIPADFPFEFPSLFVEHERFARFPHVIWSKQICLFQSKIEWNPADGLYGFFDRLWLWLGKAAINNMDPVDGPLEPPHHVTDFSHVPFVIRCNAPVPAGTPWFGLAELEKHPNRIELVGWNDMTGDWPDGRVAAFSVILEKALPMEFPEKGSEFFRELLKQGVDRRQIITNLALASLFAGAGEPIYLILGLPMRRAVDGSTKLHIAVWTTESNLGASLRKVLPGDADTETIRGLRQEFLDLLYSFFEKTKIKWCKVLEDRSEIVVRRDFHCPVEWFAGKRILILGCGALGSWTAEIVARANAGLIHLVDNSIVKPGLLARQNYRVEDIGAMKAAALSNRLREIIPSASIKNYDQEAFRFIFEDVNRFKAYDMVLDCTASSIFQMKLERDWRKFECHSPPIISFIIDSSAHRCLSVVVAPNSEGSVWNAYSQLKFELCLNASWKDFASAFYSHEGHKDLFQPEPGCSDPTFVGSTADVASLASTALNLALKQYSTGNSQVGIAFSAYGQEATSPRLKVFKLPHTQEVTAGNYRVFINPSVYKEASAWVRQNNRIRSAHHETGGLVWGLWDDAVSAIWVFDISGPPPDSRHEIAQFVCGVEGTIDEHKLRAKKSYGACGFIGFWHTHPDALASQSAIDIRGMAQVVATIGQNQKRAIMLIFGRSGGQSTVGVHIYESYASTLTGELISVGVSQLPIETDVV